MHTPGHTPACVTYVIGDAAFVGDTLFMPDYGTARADFPGGDAATLYRSIRRYWPCRRKRASLSATTILPAGARQAGVGDDSCRGARANIHVHDGVSEEEFVQHAQWRATRRWPPPKLILPSLQVNIRGGALPKPEADGKVYLKTPVTVS